MSAAERTRTASSAGDDDGYHRPLLGGVESSSAPASSRPGKEGRRQWRYNPRLATVFLLGVSFLLLFLSFSTIQNYEAVLNGHWGFWSLAMIYLSFSASTFVAAPLVSRLGPVTALFIGSMCYTAYICANLYPTPFVLLPFSVVLGFGAALLWTAQGTLVARCSDSSTIGLYTGVFFAVFMCNSVIGNPVAAVLFKQNVDVFVIVCIFAAISACANVTFLMLRDWPAKPDAQGKQGGAHGGGGGDSGGGPVVLQMLKLFAQPKMLLLAPIVVFSGMSQSFFFGVLPTRVGDKSLIGWVMALWGICDSLGSIVNGKLSDVIGRRPVLLMGGAFEAAGFVLTFFGNGTPQRLWMFFAAAAALGAGDSSFNTQLVAIVAHLQPDSTAAGFAFFRLFQSLATAAAFFYAPYVPTVGQIAIVGFFLVLGLACMLICDLFVARLEVPRKKKAAADDGDGDDSAGASNAINDGA